MKPKFTNHRTSQFFNSLVAFGPFIENSKDELMIGILHPGGGQYDCLSLMNETSPVLQLNLEGSAHVNGRKYFNMPDIWDLINPDNAEEIGTRLFLNGNFERAYDSSHREPLLAMLEDIALQFANHPDQAVELRWGWFDSSEDSASNIPEFPENFPPYWQDVKPVASSYYDWSANILKVEVDGRITATYNQRTCEKLDTNVKLTRFIGEN